MNYSYLLEFDERKKKKHGWFRQLASLVLRTSPFNRIQAKRGRFKAPLLTNAEGLKTNLLHVRFPDNQPGWNS